ncbi:MAG: hemerythrin family protein [Methyloprofundus sp.]|nr:hemerythrin family protein [Methyloprofundus sp.]
MQNNNVLEAGQIPQVAMDAMNTVHHEELMIVNDISTAIANDDNVRISNLCDQWLEHTKAHFARENTLMETHGFPAFHCHHGEHIEALEGLESIIKGWKENADLNTLTTYVRETWPGWYINHISTMDTVTSAFIKSCL